VVRGKASDDGLRSDLKLEAVGKFARLKEHSFQLVPPKLLPGACRVGGNENGGGHLILFEERFRVQEIISITVIEGDRH
jgi:hypothetical protein